MKKTNNNIDRREFLKRMGAGSLLTAAAFTGCKPNDLKIDPSVVHGEIPTDKMTYRTNERVGDKVSILGYGCMRWPFLEDGTTLDQETINELVDYAIAHGVNYFDTSPVYCQTKSEEATGIALSRYPRNSYYLADRKSVV